MEGDRSRVVWAILHLTLALLIAPPLESNRLTSGLRRRAAADDACDDAKVEAAPKMFAGTAGRRERELETARGMVGPLFYEIWRFDGKFSLDIESRKLGYLMMSGTVSKAK